MKRILATLLCLSVLLGCVGCAAKGGKTDDLGEATAAQTVISYRTFRVDDKSVMQTLIEKFENENPGIKVNYIPEGDENAYYQKLQADLLSGQDVDVFDTHLRTEFFSYQRNGYLADLSDLPFNQNYDESAKLKASVDGKNYGYIPCVNALPIFYNKAMFTQMNIAPPQTYAELVAVVEASKNAGYGGISYCGATVAGTWLGKNAMLVNVGAQGLYDWWGEIDAGAVKKIDGDVAHALSFVSRVQEDSLLFENSDAISYDQAVALFAQGMASMLMMGTWDLCNLETTYADIDVGIFPLPLTDSEVKVYAESGQITSVYANSPNVEAAKKFVDFLATAENAQIYLEFAKSIPTIAGVAVQSDAGVMVSDMMETYSMEILPGISFDNVDVWNGTVDNTYRALLYGATGQAAAFAEFEHALTKADLGKK